MTDVQSGTVRPAGVKVPPYLASRWKRFAGYLIDYPVATVPVVALAMSAFSKGLWGDFTKYQFFEMFTYTPEYALASVYVILLGAIQAVLLIKRGQTIGKVVVRTRIVTLDNRHPSWWRLVLVRPIIVLLGLTRPDIQWTEEEWGTVLRFVFGGLFLVNALLVFNEDRRALHDVLAGTRVIDMGAFRRGNRLPAADATAGG